MVRKVTPKKAATRKLRAGDVDRNDPRKYYKDSLSMNDDAWWAKKNPNIPNMRIVGTVNPRFVPSNTPAPTTPRNPKFNSSAKPFQTPPMSSGSYRPYVPPQVNRTGVEKIGRGGGIRGLGRKIFGER